MGDKTHVEWTEATWNPIAAFLEEDIEYLGRKFAKGTRGWFCTKVSPGCAHCYAEGINVRLGNGLHYLPVNLDKIEFRLVNLDQPLRWKQPRMIFVNSMTDLFHEAIPDALIDLVFAFMALASQHTFQVLTKRAQRMRDCLAAPDLRARIVYRIAEVGYLRGPDFVSAGAKISNGLTSGASWPLPNVWLGVSAADQERAKERIPLLLETPAAIRFVSAEPLLGSIDLKQIPLPQYRDGCGERSWPGIDWAIIGGESGPKARECNVEWITDLVRQCQAAGVAPFVKQLGAKPILRGEPIKLSHPKGGDWSKWPEELRVRELPR